MEVVAKSLILGIYAIATKETIVIPNLYYKICILKLFWILTNSTSLKKKKKKKKKLEFWKKI